MQDQKARQLRKPVANRILRAIRDKVDKAGLWGGVHAVTKVYKGLVTPTS